MGTGENLYHQLNVKPCLSVHKLSGREHELQPNLDPRDEYCCHTQPKRDSFDLSFASFIVDLHPIADTFKQLSLCSAAQVDVD
jgi:hypothetical protein